eukprot:GHRR01001920.1.p1 GENE.GHRR01001920.1~~GHRR01001920.1.p1  ORF type:complete len:162 (+),score=31.40 GHRR01001920.1:561-1046(+)
MLSHRPNSLQHSKTPRQVAPHRVQRPQSRVTVWSTGGAAPAATAQAPPQKPITLTDKALSHLRKLQQEAGSNNLMLRVGVKQGGCSGMSYVMDFEQPENVENDDYVVDYDGGSFKLVCDPKSLLYIFGMRLDYNDALIGGGFQFHNPNATDSCGCGKSFGV